MKKINIIILMLVFISSNAAAASLTIHYFQSDQRYTYRIELLKLALEKTLETDGSYVLEPEKNAMTQARGIKYLEQGEKINVAFLPTTAEREKKLLPVKIPMLRGILGYRVFLIHKDNLTKFATIKTLEQLKTKYRAGFGAHWADLEILKFNEIPVDETVKYLNLFIKLEYKRFDYFPRGINEAWKEVETFAATYPNLMVDTYLAFYYPYPVYFFVNKQNSRLAKRIERGLTLSLKDNSFKELFLAFHKDIIAHAKLGHRKLFRLENPTLPVGTPDPDTSWWIEPTRVTGVK